MIPFVNDAKDENLPDQVKVRSTASLQERTTIVRNLALCVRIIGWEAAQPEGISVIRLVAIVSITDG